MGGVQAGQEDEEGRKDILVIATLSFPEPRAGLRSLPTETWKSTVMCDFSCLQSILNWLKTCNYFSFIRSKASILLQRDGLALLLIGAPQLGSGQTSLPSVMHPVP